MAKLSVSPREIAGKKVKQLREEGKLPAVLFGPDFEPTNVLVDDKEFRAVFKENGYSSLIDVITPEGEKEKVLFKEIQQHPVTDEILHVSMYVVDPKKPITAEVPLEYIGTSKAEKDGLGFVAYSLDSVAVRCLPKDLPSELVIDISSLATTADVIMVNEIQLPEGVEFDSRVDTNALVASIATAQKIEDVLEEIAEGEGVETEVGEDEDGEEGESGDSEDTESEEK